MEQNQWTNETYEHIRLIEKFYEPGNDDYERTRLNALNELIEQRVPKKILENYMTNALEDLESLRNRLAEELGYECSEDVPQTQKQCNGCFVNHPSQTQHSYLMEKEYDADDDNNMDQDDVDAGISMNIGNKTTKIIQIGQDIEPTIDEITKWKVIKN
ncbi:hypothetical protein ACF0H5_018260 [Mactra antiquata]